jgi:hypothetical protein
MAARWPNYDFAASGASTLNRHDGRITRDEASAETRMIRDATNLPVSPGLEKGFRDAPEIVAERVSWRQNQDWSTVRSRTQAVISAIRWSGSRPPKRGHCRSR